MKTKLFIIGSVLLLLPVCSFAQEKKINKENQQWIQYYNQLKLNDKWTLLTDGGFRWKNDFDSHSLYIVRIAGSYKINKKMSAGVGFAHLGFYNADNNINRVEFRPYQEFSMSDTYEPVTVQHRFRVEERFFNLVKEGKIQAENDFNFRFRYRVLFTIPIFALSSTDKNKKVSLSLGDEIMVNAGKEIVNNVFDQNRLLLGTVLNLDKNIAVSFTYNDQFAATKTAGNYNHSNVLWLGVTQKLDVSKAK